MPDATVPSFILDAYGRQARYANGNLYEATTDTTGRYQRRPKMATDYAALLNQPKWTASINDCRELAKQGLVRNCVVQKWQYISASGWAAVFTGEDSDWGDEAEAALASADLAASVRGSRWPFEKIFELGGRTWESDGAFFLLLTQTADGFPQFQPLEAHRIGQRDTALDLVASGPYRGLRIQNGIITNLAGHEVAYRVLGPTDDDDLDISARDLWHIAPADNFSENRPLPGIARGSLDLFDIRTARKSQLAQQILDSKLTLIETNDSGRRDPVAVAMGSAPLRTPAGTPTDVFEDAMTRFVKSGFDLKAWQAARPSDQWMNYDEKTIKSAIGAIGWRAEALDPALIGTGAPARALQDIINTTIFAGFKDLRPYVIRARQYQIAKLVQAKRLRPSDEWMKWDTPAPAEFTVDPARTISSDLDAARAGADNIPNIQRRWGLNPKQTLIGAAKHIRLQQRIAAQYDVPVESLGRLDQPGHAPAAAAPAASPATPAGNQS